MITYSFKSDCEPQNNHLEGTLIIDEVSVKDDDKVIGYLKMAHVSANKLKNIKSIWQYKSYKGWCLPLTDRKGLWLGAHHYAN